MRPLIKKLTATVALMLVFTLAIAQGALDDIRSSIGSGNTGGVSRYFDNTVSMTIAGSRGTYSSSQAEMVLRGFFSKINPKGFTTEHSGGGKQHKYVIGTLKTSCGSYRAYFSVREDGGRYVIQEIRIEK